jgi:hypothetical protein
VANEVEHRWTIVIGDNGFAVASASPWRVIRCRADTMPSRQNAEAVVSIKSPRAGGVRWPLQRVQPQGLCGPEELWTTKSGTTGPPASEAIFTGLSISGKCDGSQSFDCNRLDLHLVKIGD